MPKTKGFNVLSHQIKSFIKYESYCLMFCQLLAMANKIKSKHIYGWLTFTCNNWGERETAFAQNVMHNTLYKYKRTKVVEILNDNNRCDAFSMA